MQSKITPTSSRWAFLVLIVLFLSSCQTPKPNRWDRLKETLKEPVLPVQYDTLNIESPQQIQLVYPKLQNSVFRHILWQAIAEDTATTFCDNPAGETQIYYEVKWYSQHLLSWSKVTDIMFCYASDVVSQDFYNLWIDQGKPHQIQLNKGYSFKSLISKADTISECHFDTTAHQNLYFTQHQAMLSLRKDKVCQTAIPLVLSDKTVLIAP